MTLASDQWSCETCGVRFQHAGDPAPAQCPSCDSTRLRRAIRLTDQIGVRVSERIRLRGKDNRLPSRRKLRLEIRSGPRAEGSGTGRIVDERRVVDHDANVYEERIVDAATGLVIKDVTEPLSSHRSGSQKRDRRKTR